MKTFNKIVVFLLLVCASSTVLAQDREYRLLTGLENGTLILDTIVIAKGTDAREVLAEFGEPDELNEDDGTFAYIYNDEGFVFGVRDGKVKTVVFTMIKEGKELENFNTFNGEVKIGGIKVDLNTAMEEFKSMGFTCEENSAGAFCQSEIKENSIGMTIVTYTEVGMAFMFLFL